MKDLHFHNAKNEPIVHSGEPITWRISVQALIRQKNTILLIKDKRFDFYSTPGGGVEVEESFEEALQREMMEETGSHVRMGKLLQTHEGWVPSFGQKDVPS